ncbi:MAG: hypothetical protein K8S54_17475 [Spirochaetia bacterium]|nr:hypothetical protein [Spirochaetia bacterium]
MKIISPGHSEAFLEMQNADGKTIRVLLDAWLSDFAFGDLLARNPFSIDFKSIPVIDAIYISHTHCDHLDPYTLVPLYKIQNPILLLPETAAFLQPLIQQNLPQAKIQILRHAKKERILGLDFTAFAFPSSYLTNEEDVMPLCIASPEEAFFFEADTALPDDPAAHEAVTRSVKHAKDRVFLSTRNELEALYASYDARNSDDRKRSLAAYKSKREHELSWEYERYAELDLACPFDRPAVRVLAGQGMVLPAEIDPGAVKLSAPFPLSDVLVMERRMARDAGFTGLHFEALKAGMELTIEKAGHAKPEIRTGKATWLTSSKSFPVTFENASAPITLAKPGPIRPDSRDADAQKIRFLALLNHRFLPFQTYHREEPLKKILATESPYIIRIRFGNSQANTVTDFGIDFGKIQFQELPLAERKYNEIYWANDLDDFMLGMQDQFSTTLHHLEPGTALRLWTMMGMPFLNSDFVQNKIAFHFERAARGLTVNDWMKDILEGRP